MKLSSPTHAVIGVSDLEASLDFVARFGFTEASRGVLPLEAAVALYGLAGEPEEAMARVPGAERGWLRLVATESAARSTATLDSRPFAIDLFSTDLEASLEIAADGGWPAGPIATHQFGPLVIREVEIHGPDRLILTLLETTARKPTILDDEPERLHSELHAVVWSVQDADRHLEFWERATGLEKVTDAVMEGEQLALALGLGSDRSIRARLVVLCDEAERAARFELIEFLGEKVEEVAGWPLAAGLHAAAFEVGDLTDAMAALPAGYGEPVDVASGLHAGWSAVSGHSPQGIYFELWQPPAEA